jgi:outer membrane biosynthesis protein TonB
MKKPFAISIGFHAAILLAALVVLPTPKPFEVKPQEAIQVDISNISDKTQKMATAKDAVPAVEKPAPKETKVVQDVPPAPKVDDKVNNAVNAPKPPPPPPEPPKPEPPKPEPPKKVEPKPVDQAALDSLLKTVDEPKPEKKPDPKPPKETVKPVDKPVEKKKPELKLDEIAALLNKDKGEHTAPQKPAKEVGAPKLAAADTSGEDAAMTATIIDALTSKVKTCFNVPPAARDANISVRIHFKLNQDGSVNGQPEVASMSSSPIFDATARAAISAIMECQNYELPAEQYNLWQDNTLDFNPNLFFG